MAYYKNEEHRKEPMPDHLKRTPRSFRATDYQYDCIRRRATACGLTASDYILCRSLDYEPRIRMTIEQENLLIPLQKFTSSVKKLFATIKSVDANTRYALIREAPFIVKWTQALLEDRAIIMEVIHDIKCANKLPPAESGTSKPNNQ